MATFVMLMVITFALALICAVAALLLNQDHA
jgi:hypothetical protein